MAKPYYLTCYGHVLRVSSRCDSPSAAFKEMFGLKHLGRDGTCYEVTGSGWIYKTAKQRNELKIAAAQFHYDKTGLTIKGYENDIIKKKVPT